MLAERIVKYLSDAVFPQSVAEMAGAMPGVAPVAIEQACYTLREQRQLGRNGADTASSPYRFYVKRKTVESVR